MAPHYRALALLLSALLGSTPFFPLTDSLTGAVIDEAGQPLAGVRVRIKASAIASVTNNSGRFQLPRQPGHLTAAKAGYFIGGSAPSGSGALICLAELPNADNTRYQWVDPRPGRSQACGTCHEEIYREWSASAHSRSATGSHFRDLYEGTDAAGRPGVSWGLRTEFHDGAGVCSSCHAPALSDDDPARFDLGLLTGTAVQNVHCDFCHKIAATDTRQIGLTHGRYALKLLRPAGGQLFFGPLDDVDRGEDAYSPLYRESRYCASCHEGVVFGVHVYGTYSEWLTSPARQKGKQCQDCHMAPTGTMTNIAPDHGGVERAPRTVASHRLFAGSQADMLRRAVQVTTAVEREGDAIHVGVTIRADGAGHRVPTGFIDRHMLLVVDGIDSNGKLARARSGPRLDALAGAELAGRSGRLFGRSRRDFNGVQPAPFWRGGSDPVDTRLTPDHGDVSDYTFSEDTGRIRVRLLYRRFWKEVIDAKGWHDSDTVVADRVIDLAPQLEKSPCKKRGDVQK